jgi:hypothetical protein
MFLLVGTIILTSLNMGVWTLIGAVIRFFGWFGDARGQPAQFPGAKYVHPRLVGFQL